MTKQEMTMNDAVAATIRAELAARQVQLKDIAPSISVSPRTLSRIVNGQAEIGITTLVELADALGMQANEIWSKAAERLVQG